MIRIPRSIIIGFLLVPLIILAIFFFKVDQLEQMNQYMKWITIGSFVLALLDLSQKMLRANRYVISFSLKEYIGIIAGPMSFFVMAFITYQEIYYGISFGFLILFMILSLSGMGAMMKIGVSNEGIYYNDKIITFDTIESYEVYESQINFTVVKPFLSFEIFHIARVEKTLDNTEDYNQLVLLLGSEYREKEEITS